MLGVRLFRLFEITRRRGCDCTAVRLGLLVLAVPAGESDVTKLLLAGAAVPARFRSPPSSEAMSVMRDDIMLGGPATACRGNCGRLLSSLLAVGDGVFPRSLSGKVAMIGDRSVEASLQSSYNMARGRFLAEWCRGVGMVGRLMQIYHKGFGNGGFEFVRNWSEIPSSRATGSSSGSSKAKLQVRQIACYARQWRSQLATMRCRA